MVLVAGRQNPHDIHQTASPFVAHHWYLLYTRLSLVTLRCRSASLLRRCGVEFRVCVVDCRRTEARRAESAFSCRGVTAYFWARQINSRTAPPPFPLCIHRPLLSALQWIAQTPTSKKTQTMSTVDAAVAEPSKPIGAKRARGGAVLYVCSLECISCLRYPRFN